MLTVRLSNQLKSQSGGIYYEVMLLDHTVRVSINQRWKAAAEAAKAAGTKNKEPSFTLQALLDRGTRPHTGKGAAWMFIRKEGKVHQGDMILNNKDYLVDIRRDGLEFVLQLTPKEPISLSSI